MSLRRGGSSPLTDIQISNWIMSLLSSQDRQMAVEALEYYIQKLKDDNCNQAAITSFQTLLNWIELEQYKKGD